MFGADRELMGQWLWLVAIGGPIVFCAVVLLGRKKERTNGDSALLTLGLTLVVLGVIFGDDPLAVYLFIGFGILASIASAVRSWTEKVNKGSANRGSRTAS